MADRRFPLICPPNTLPEYRSCSWTLAERAYAEYAKRYGTSQSLERIAERGGFGACEMIELLDRSLDTGPGGSNG